MKNFLIIIFMLLSFMMEKNDNIDIIKEWDIATLNAIDLLSGDVDSVYLNSIKEQYDTVEIINSLRRSSLNKLIEEYDTLFANYFSSEYLILEVIDYGSCCFGYDLTILKLEINDNVTEYIYHSDCETIIKASSIDKKQFIESENNLLQIAEEYDYLASKEDVYSIISFISKGKIIVLKPIIGSKEYIY